MRERIDEFESSEGSEHHISILQEAKGGDNETNLSGNFNVPDVFLTKSRIYNFFHSKTHQVKECSRGVMAPKILTSTPSAENLNFACKANER